MSLVSAFLQSLVVWVGTPSVQITPVESQGWAHSKEWVSAGDTLTFEASSNTVLEQCHKNPDASLTTPVTIQTAQELLLDGKRLAVGGDPTLKQSFRMYTFLSIPCAQLPTTGTVTWKAYTATTTLAHVGDLPFVGTKLPLFQFSSATLPTAVAAGLLAIGFIGLALFYGKTSRSILGALVLGSLSLCVCFASWVPDVFMIDGSPLEVVKVGDTSLWLGVACLFHIFAELNYAYRYSRIVTAGCLAGVAVIMAAANLDQIQIGDSIGFIGAFLFVFSMIFKAWRGTSWKSATKIEYLKLGAALVFAITCINDILMFQGSIDTVSVFPLGVVSCVMLLTLTVNENIMEAYRERDYLRDNLEHEVHEKTFALRTKSVELETALSDLKIAQAEIVQSAKLASLGTLSAGIAHEINNALNFVNGSLQPLQNTLAKEALSESARKRVDKLMVLMKEGLELTFGIIVNLKRHAGSGTNGKERELIDLKSAVEGVLTLLKGKTPPSLEIEVQVKEGMQVMGNPVGLSQILMNLMLNSVHALEEKKAAQAGFGMKLSFSGDVTENGVPRLRVHDNGPGIPPEIQDRIFDPFFTTKAVGKGTGLGLHIATTEMQKHGGKISVTSDTQNGTCFTLEFAKEASLRDKEAA